MIFYIGGSIVRIAVCDDEKYFRGILKRKLEIYAKKKAMIFLYDDFADGKELLKSTCSYDLIFLDYKMDELNGIDTARKLREKNDKTTIIFLTSIIDAVYDSFEVNTFRFLSKPIDDDRLYKALDDFLKSLNENNFLSLMACPKIIRIEYDDILYIEAKGKSCTIHTINKTIEYPQLLLTVEDKLPEDRFLRCHKSFIIGFKHISARDGSKITFTNGEKVDLSRKNTDLFKTKYIDYLKRYSFERE